GFCGVGGGDLFNHGNMGAVVDELVGSPMVLGNHGVGGPHLVGFGFAGTKSNRLANGGKVKIGACGVTQTEEIHSGGSYLSQNDLRVHFGLNKATMIDSVEIRWPSGSLDRVKNLAVDRFYAVLEGKGIVPPEQIRPLKKP